MRGLMMLFPTLFHHIHRKGTVLCTAGYSKSNSFMGSEAILNPHELHETVPSLLRSCYWENRCGEKYVNSDTENRSRLYRLHARCCGGMVVTSILMNVLLRRLGNAHIRNTMLLCIFVRHPICIGWVFYFFMGESSPSDRSVEHM
ncbi:hypothetical protein GALMADRAFT_620864 [Galerina marginata CBS 339.88]|uniref:Uncharacterized protein n=1 Tax=Galerina marginata (strain CBS 339.88) TaxID=685588 RepID=A0A067SRL6_GALM3|nr:hypothetical protein GALMADRAFT_620864 [Galerina marginata CBS 339.88]